MSSLATKKLLMIAGIALSSSAAFASTDWVGTADYRNAVGAEGDEAVAGPFDTYDFGAGIGLIKPDSTVEPGKTFKGWFQTMVSSHIFQGSGVSLPELNISGSTGSGGGFELTLVSEFEGSFSNFGDGTLGFNLHSGTVTLLFDSSPDFSFAGDSGFTDGTPILLGSLSGGSGQVSSVSQYGYEVVSVDFAGPISIVDPAIFNPSNIIGGTTLFSITASSPFTSTPVIDRVIAGSGSVMGFSGSAGEFFELDGNLKFVVPVPPAAWLFLSGLIGFLRCGTHRIRNA
ncbi:MAG: flocculation-associated PEP-CTERM protein PepA [Gammaproteobacteria bacterium]